MSDFADDEFCFWSPEVDRCFYSGGIGVYHPAIISDAPEPPFFELAFDLKDVCAVIRFIQKSFPKGWKVEDGELVSL